MRARNLDRDPAACLACLACEWLPPKFDYVDPKKDVEASILAINAGLKSRRQAISERSYDAEQVDAEIAYDKARTEGSRFSEGHGDSASDTLERMRGGFVKLDKTSQRVLPDGTISLP